MLNVAILFRFLYVDILIACASISYGVSSLPQQYIDTSLTLRVFLPLTNPLSLLSLNREGKSVQHINNGGLQIF